MHSKQQHKQTLFVWGHTYYLNFLIGKKIHWWVEGFSMCILIEMSKVLSNKLKMNEWILLTL